MLRNKSENKLCELAHIFWGGNEVFEVFIRFNVIYEGFQR